MVTSRYTFVAASVSIFVKRDSTLRSYGPPLDLGRHQPKCIRSSHDLKKRCEHIMNKINRPVHVRIIINLFVRFESSELVSQRLEVNSPVCP